MATAFTTHSPAPAPPRRCLLRRFRVVLLLLPVAVFAASPSKGACAQAPPPARPGSGACLSADAAADFAALRFEAAAHTLQAQVLAQPGCVAARYRLAESLLRLGKARAALAEYTAAAQLQSPSATDLRNVALAYALLEDYSDAARWAERALNLHPEDADTLYVLGRIRYSAHNYLGAAAAFEHALALEPRSAKLKNNLGLASEGLGQPERAAAAYREAIALGDAQGKPSEQPLINLASLLLHGGDAAAALPLLLRAVALAPGEPRAWEQLGRTRLAAGQLPEAQQALERATSLAPADARLHFLLGQVYRRQGRKEQAAAEFARTAALDGTHSTPEPTSP